MKTMNEVLRLLVVVLALCVSGSFANDDDDNVVYDDDIMNNLDDNYNSGYNNYNNQNYEIDDVIYGDAQDDDGNGDDGAQDVAQDDDANGDDANGDEANGDDGQVANGDDNNNAAADDDDNSNKYAKYQDDWYSSNQDYGDDDLFHWSENIGFEEVSVMPLSCVEYNNGQMIKYAFHKTENGYHCRLNEIGVFVVSIAHYMRAYFNHQALLYGEDFALPADVAYLNCVPLQQKTNSNNKLYAKIGCRERGTLSSTSLALHLYTDETCSTAYDDGYSSKRHASKGYDINGYMYSSRVSFRPPFYSCQNCNVEEIAETYNKKSGNWYDDDYISHNGYSQGNEEKDKEDDYYADDAYLAANDDIDYNNRQLAEESQQEDARSVTPADGVAESYYTEFWNSVREHNHRSLYDNAYDANEWNMCQRVYKYGMWCDEECRDLDIFKNNEWSRADIVLLSIMCTFMTAMMLLILAKRLKAAQKARVYRQVDLPLPGLPPLAMLALYGCIMLIVIIMASFKVVNETLTFAVVSCLLLFIYMLKLTLFDTRRPVLLATRNDLFDNPLDERLN